jgi:hypothetical protein
MCAYMPVLTALEAEENSSTVPGWKCVYRLWTHVIPFINAAKKAPPTKTTHCQPTRYKSREVSYEWELECILVEYPALGGRRDMVVG